jgi:hypothetical protein
MDGEVVEMNIAWKCCRFDTMDGEVVVVVGRVVVVVRCGKLEV